MSGKRHIMMSNDYDPSRALEDNPMDWHTFKGLVMHTKRLSLTISPGLAQVAHQRA